jgi:hypothetical protein
VGSASPGRTRQHSYRPPNDDGQDAARAWCAERAGGDDLRRAGRLRANGGRGQWRAPPDPYVLVRRRARAECRRGRSARRDLRWPGGRAVHAPAQAARWVAWPAHFRVRARHARRRAEPISPATVPLASAMKRLTLPHCAARVRPSCERCVARGAATEARELRLSPRLRAWAQCPIGCVVGSASPIAVAAAEHSGWPNPLALTPSVKS